MTVSALKILKISFDFKNRHRIKHKRMICGKNYHKYQSFIWMQVIRSHEREDSDIYVNQVQLSSSISCADSNSPYFVSQDDYMNGILVSPKTIRFVQYKQQKLQQIQQCMLLLPHYIPIVHITPAYVVKCNSLTNICLPVTLLLILISKVIWPLWQNIKNNHVFRFRL